MNFEITKSFPAICYNSRTQRTDRVKVVWKYESNGNRAKIIEIVGKAGDISIYVPSYEKRALIEQVNRKAMNLTVQKRTKMMLNSHKRSITNKRSNNGSIQIKESKQSKKNSGSLVFTLHKGSRF